MFGGLTSWIQKGIDVVAAQVGDAAKLDDAYSEKPTTESGAPDGAAAEPTESSNGLNLPPWENPPVQFIDHKEEWKELILGMLLDENSCIVSSSHLFSVDGVQQKFDQLVNDETALPAMSTAESESLKRAIQVAIAGHLSEAERLRFRICPRWVSDAHLWENLTFRLVTFHRCKAIEQCLDVLDLVNTEPTPRPVGLTAEGGVTAEDSVRKRNVGSWLNAATLQQIRDSVLAKRSVTEWSKSKKTQALDIIENGKNAYQMLSNLLQNPNESVELLDSVAESCKYHKGKIAAIIGELSSPGAAEKVPESFGLTNGPIFEQLLALNEDLHKVLETYGARPAQPLASSSSNPHQGHSPSQSTPSGSTAISAPTLQRSSSKAGSGSPTGFADTDTTAFNAQLPWDDDE